MMSAGKARTCAWPTFQRLWKDHRNLYNELARVVGFTHQRQRLAAELEKEMPTARAQNQPPIAAREIQDAVVG
jgi:hypothetical protein